MAPGSLDNQGHAVLLLCLRAPNNRLDEVALEQNPDSHIVQKMKECGGMAGQPRNDGKLDGVGIRRSGKAQQQFSGAPEQLGVRTMKKTIVLAITAVATLSMTAVVMGQGRGRGHRPTPDQAAVGFRQALMTLINGEAGPMIQMQRGRMPYNQALVEKNAGNLVTLAGMIPDAFERNTSSAANVRTRALPIVWQDHGEFLMHAHDLRMRAEALDKAAMGGNEDDVKAAIKNTGAVCGECHMKFRGK